MACQFTRGFVSPHGLRRHFIRHGSEVGAATEDEYETLADGLFGRALDENILECTRRRDGAIVRCSVLTGELAITKQGHLLTYFIFQPGSTGPATVVEYFNAECDR